jgi:DNA-binding CsgD family transcriptional regulator
MTLEQQIEARIAQIIPAADFFPGVAIVHNLRSMGVEYMSELGLRLLGTTMAELRADGSDYNLKYFNRCDAADYLPKIKGLLERNNDNEIISFFQQVRTVDCPDWVWFLSTIRIFMRDDAGKPLLSLTFACPISMLNHVTPKVERLLEENNFMRENQGRFAQLTRRERQVLQLLAQGKNSAAIAKELFIAPNTVITHRRNINAKLHPKAQQDLARYALAFDLV